MLLQFKAKTRTDKSFRFESLGIWNVSDRLSPHTSLVLHTCRRERGGVGKAFV